MFPTGLCYFVTLSIFHSFVRGLSGSTNWDFSPSPAAANSPAQSSQLAQAPAEPTPSPGVSEDPAHAALQLASLERETAHSSLPRQLLVFTPEHKPQTPGNKSHGPWTCLRHKHSVVKFLTVVSVYNTVFANTALINIKCFVKAFVESSLEVW